MTPHIINATQNYVDATQNYVDATQNYVDATQNYVANNDVTLAVSYVIIYKLYVRIFANVLPLADSFLKIASFVALFLVINWLIVAVCLPSQGNTNMVIAYMHEMQTRVREAPMCGREGVASGLGICLLWGYRSV